MPRRRKQPDSESDSSSSDDDSDGSMESSEEESWSNDSESSAEDSYHGGDQYDDDEGGYDYDEEDDADYDPMNDALDALIDSVFDYDYPDECWEYVRGWLREHSVEETKEAVELKGEFDTTALHVACRNRPPLDVVEIMLMAAPDMIFWADSFGWLPLHYACANGTEIEIVKLLLDTYPDSKLTTDKRGRTPLHFALGNVENPPTPALVKLLAGKSGESAKWPDENAMLPIHYACAYGATVEVLTVLIHAWEESMQRTDAKGRTPLHFAMGNADRENSPSVVELLLELSPGCMHQIDAEKNLPLNLLSTKAESVEETQFETRDTIQNCLDIYLKAKPKTSIEFLTGIQKMPEWLRDIAVIHPTVQTMLNTKISSRFPTMILMLDFYFLAAAIASFSITSRESISRRFNPNNTSDKDRMVTPALLSPLYIAAIYFLGREITQMISVRSQTTVFAYLLEPENMLNLAFVFLTMYYTILMQTGLGDDHRFRTGVSVTMGICYLQVLAYLKSILIDFAVFVSSLTYVTTRLVAFSVCLMITVAAFAQMWYTIFRQSSECYMAAAEEEDPPENETIAMLYDDDEFYYPEEPEGPDDCEPSIDYPFCHSLFYSFYKAFTMMLGEIDDTIFYWNTFSLVLFCIFFFVEVVILLNILIAIVTDLYGVVTGERAAIVFWSNRLAFITDMDMITNGPWKKTVMGLFRLRDDDDEDDEEEAALMKNDDKVDVSWERILWKKLIECFDPEVDSNGMGMILYVPLRVFISMFLIPFWLLLGILSAGWLWPPQVREGLFVQKVSMPEDGEENEMEKRVEEVTDLQKELKAVQDHLASQFLQDQKEVAALKDRVKDIKRELKEEMKNIKGVMTSLFEVQQRAMIS